MCRRKSNVGGYCAAFGAGLLVASIFPSDAILFLLAGALVLLGLVSVKR